MTPQPNRSIDVKAVLWRNGIKGILIFLLIIQSAALAFAQCPAIFRLSGGGVIPSGSSGSSVLLSDSEADATYQLKLNNSNLGAALTGTGESLQWTGLTGEGTYTVVATKTSNGCTTLQSGSPKVLIAPSNITSLLNNSAFQYKYDARRRMTHKKVPGAEVVYMVYDNRDRLVMTQDGEQRKVNKWSYTKYDALNRAVMTGIYTHTESVDQEDMSTLISTTHFYEAFDAVQTPHGYTNTVFPIENTEVLTVTYYDNYEFRPLLGSDEFNYKPNLLSSQTRLNGTFSQQASGFNDVTGQVTGMKTKILGQNLWLSTVNYYDDKYRLIQTTANTHRNGIERTTNIIDFAGKVLAYGSMNVEGTTIHNVIRTFEHDHAGRLLKTWHSLDGATPVLLMQNEYNALGQLVTKKLHNTENPTVTADPLVGQPGVRYANTIEEDEYNNEVAYIANTRIKLTNGFRVKPGQGQRFTARIGYSQQDADAHNSAPGTFHQAIDYRYNIRGWLTNINDPSAPQPEDLFNMELRYNNPTGNGGAAQYNGNISESIWNSAGLDKQSYGYSYDPMNRLTDAQYHNITTPAENGRYNEKIGNLTLPTPRPGYDLNGNILSLFRSGKTGESAFGSMDDLRYTYTNGNQLSAVSDAIALQAGENGFKDAAGGTVDYAYDANGNMYQDQNKGIDTIVYNHLNLPAIVTKIDGNYLKYIYDATGRKLSQQVFNSSHVEQKKTDYIGEYFYEKDSPTANETLKFINHEEGRIVMTGAAPEYQYNLKDHLGNVRLTFTTRPSTESSAVATLEAASTGDEQSQFLRYDEAVKIDYDVLDHTNNDTTFTSQRLAGGNTVERYGLAKSLSVMPGDTIKMEVFAKYIDPETSNWQAGLTNFMTAMSTMAAPLKAPVDGAVATQKASLNLPFGNVFAHNTEGGTAPKAYLNYVVFDRDYKPIPSQSGYVRISETARENGSDVAHERLAPPQPLVIKEPGYVYIYLSNENETPVEVFFDDFSVTQVPGPVVQVDDYYPFGLTFNDYQRENSVENRIKFNGREEQNELGWNVYDYKRRFYDQALGRFLSVDPLASSFPWWTPYQFSGNMPTKFVDLDGMEPGYYDPQTKTIIPASDHFRHTPPTNAQYLNSVSTEKIKKSNEASNAALSFMPIVGDGIDLNDTRNDFREGNYGMGLLSAASLIPGADIITKPLKTLLKNRKVGKLGEKIVTESLQKELGEGKEVLEQVSGKFSDGSRTQFDNVVIDKKTGKVEIVNETKTGNASYTDQQSRYYEGGETVTLSGKKAQNAGVSGQQVNSSTTQSRTTRVKREDE